MAATRSSDHASSPLHSHGGGGSSGPALIGAAAANIALTIFELVAAVLAGSVALAADALHNLNDALALVVAAVARRAARRRPDAEYTFGYRRAELIGAIINLTAMIVAGGFLALEAGKRFFLPVPVGGTWMMAAAGVALAVDVATAAGLWATGRGGLNLRAVFVHNLADAFASVAVLLGGAAVTFLGWDWIDSTLTVLIAGYMIVSSLRLLRRTVRILMEGTPSDLDLGALSRVVLTVPDVTGIHHVHVWTLAEDRRALEAHVVLRESGWSRWETRKRRLKEILREQFDITHATLEAETDAARCDEGTGMISELG